MKVVDTNEMKEIEKQAFSRFGMDESLIIENVGIRGADFIEQNYLKNQAFEEGELAIFVGPGNNGADGLAIGRHLANRHYRIRAFLLFPDELSGSSSKGEKKDKDKEAGAAGLGELQKQVKMASEFGVKISEVKGVEQIESYFTQAQDQYLVVDAILGTGLHLPLSNYLFEVIELINRYRTVTISVDIPSGVAGSEGRVSSTAILATDTLAIGVPKVGHYVSQGARHSGEIHILDVGFPHELTEKGEKNLLTKELAYEFFKKRDKFAHKNNFGHVLVVGGSRGLTGALLMAGKAALKVGVGLVTAATWQENYHELASRIMPEIMTGHIPVKDEDVEYMLRYVEKYDVIVLGPGLSPSEASRRIVLALIGRFSGPIVVDADAINVLNLKTDGELLASRKALTALTPHMGELARFMGVAASDIEEKPLAFLKKAVDQTNSCFILKSSGTYLGLPSGETFINYYPNDGMASGGSGDVLAGMLGGLLAQYMPVAVTSGLFKEDKLYYRALCLGVLAHSLAGKHAAKNLGVRAMTASSIIESFTDAFQEMGMMSVPKKGDLNLRGRPIAPA